MPSFFRFLSVLGSRRTPARAPSGARPQVESLESRTVLSVTFSGPGNSGTALIAGSAQPDQFLVRLKPAEPATVQFSDDGGSHFVDAPLAGITDVQVRGFQGPDTLTVDSRNGIVGKSSGNGLPISLLAGSGLNTLVVVHPSGKADKVAVDAVTLTINPQDDTVSYLGSESSAGGAQDQQAGFLDRLYEERLGRPAAAADLAYWQGVLGQPGGQAAAVAEIAGSLEARTQLVRHWYERYLGRSLPAGDHEAYAWVQALLAGVPEEQVSAQILASAEFFARAQTLASSGSPDERFVQALYGVTLGRTARADEVGWWVAALPNLGRSGVALGFLQSREFRVQTITHLYQDLFHRDADAAGLSFWLNSSLTLEQVHEGFEVSAEFSEP